ncbi:hypothetical protein [Delftia tsuruhatensis]|uniref:hypothetical protein n=1 Tax=Delftia tsuruhatensis TaxID=180282 RepID=UPI0031DC12DE
MGVRVKFVTAMWFVSALCAVIATFALLKAYPALWPWLGSNSSNIASWVQAIGSIVAILAGFRVAKFSVEESDRRQAAKEFELYRQKYRKSCWVINDVCSQIWGWADSFYRNIDKTKDNPKFFMMGCDNARNRISSLVPDDYPDPIYVMDLTRLRIQLDNIAYLIALDDILNTPSIDGIKASIKDVLDECKNLQAELYRNAESNSTKAEIEMMEAYRKSRFGNQLQ